MPLRNELEQQGNWLFRWRSFLPFIFLPLMVVGVVTMRLPFGSEEFHEVWEFLCLCLSFVGLAIRILVVGRAPEGTSGRNTKLQHAASLSTTGFYSVVRHPLYLGNFLIGLGAVLVPFDWSLAAIYTLAFWLYYERIMLAEEGYLRQCFGEEFEAWSSATPAFIPRLSGWRPGTLPFSFRNVLGREYTGLLVIALLHCGMEEGELVLANHRIVYEFAWTTLLVVSVASYLFLRMLKRRTSVLDVAGR